MTSLLTAEDAERLPPDLRWELIDGVLIEMPPVNAGHGRIALTIGSLLRQHVHPRHLGRVYVEVGFILRRNPDTVRAPDVAFVRAERISPRGEPRGFWEIAPDLAVEVISPSNTPAEVQAKVREWIEAGTGEVWVVYPDTRTVQRVRSLLEREELSESDTLDGGTTVPGFACSVAELFD